MKHAIIFCVERGFLEDQCRLLVKAYQTFAADPNVDLIACSPRSQNLPSQNLIDALNANGVIHLTEPLNTDFEDYPIANKLLCCSYVEQNCPQYDSVLFTDTDTVFLNSITHFEQSQGLYLKPVGHKGPGTSGPTDPMDPYWTDVFSLFGMPIPPVDQLTSIQSTPIRGYFNAGYIWANGIRGFFQQWLKDFWVLHQARLVPPGFVSKDGNNFRCLDQVALAVTASRYHDLLQTLPVHYNHHLPFRPMMSKPLQVRLDQLIHIHYHKWFQHPQFLDHITSADEKKSPQYQFLKKELPIHPLIDDPFKC